VFEGARETTFCAGSSRLISRPKPSSIGENCGTGVDSGCDEQALSRMRENTKIKMVEVGLVDFLIGMVLS
jgi:hypothetical protein